MHKGQEGSSRLVISGGNSAKPLDFLEKTLHQMALFIQMPVNRCQSTGQGSETLLCGGIT